MCGRSRSRSRLRPAEPQLDETRLGIYESTARELVGAEKIEWKKIVIVSRLCENAGGAEVPKGCDDELSAAEQDELAQRLGDLGPPITFVEDPTPLYDEEWMTGAPETIVLRLGTIAESGDGVEVGGSFGCGGLCGSGTTYVLEETGTPAAGRSPARPAPPGSPSRVPAWVD